MPEPFKNLFNERLISNMGAEFSKASSGFDQEGFVSTAANGLDALELKARGAQITDALAVYLPDNFEKAAQSVRGEGR